MNTMRAISDGCGANAPPVFPVKVMESDISKRETFGSGGNYTMRLAKIKQVFSVVRFSYD